MKTKIFIFLTFFLLLSCNKKEEQVVVKYQYTIPTTFDDDLETASLETVGLNVQKISEMMDYVNSIDNHKIHNILILRNNKLVFEQYFKGYSLNMNDPNLEGAIMDYTRETDHFMASITKSVTSVIVGVAINMGYISDLNKKIIDYFPEYTDIMTGEKANITVENLLTMRAGLEFDESTYIYSDPRSDTYQMINSDDPIKYVLSKPMKTTPGTTFFYNTGTTNILARIIEKESGKSFFDFANINFFDAMKIKGGRWTMMKSGLPMASGGLYLRARELSKIGLLFENNGMWLGKQIISTDWINKSQYQYVSTADYFPNTYYGFQWWITSFYVSGKLHKCFFAAGWGEQYLFVIPDLQLVVEINSGNYLSSGKISPFDLMQNYILKSF